MTEDQRLAAIDQLNQDHRRMAGDLMVVAESMKSYCEVLRGERQDLTGFGEWNILVDNLERVMGVKVITQEQYAQFVGGTKS